MTNFRRPPGHDKPKFETEDGSDIPAVLEIHERERQMTHRNKEPFDWRWFWKSCLVVIVLCFLLAPLFAYLGG